jgi:2,4-dienoyl-CoA reductase (NADPH2)
MGSMHLGLEAGPDAGRALAAFYAERARGGAGLIVTGGAAVSRVGAGGPSYALLDEDSGRAALGPVVEAVHRHGASVALQLFHAGRYAFQETFGLQPVAPSAVPSRFSQVTPVALTEQAIWQTIEDFARAASRGRSLGFDAIELMGSEGYLVDQFLSPLTNLREDAWGGDPGRRRRFGVELARAVRAAIGPDTALIFRLTGVDLMPGSTNLAEATGFALELAQTGVDALNVGIGWHESRVPTVQGPVPPGAWVPWAQAFKRAVGPVPVIAGNRINRLEIAEHLLASDEIDFISMARPFLSDEDLIVRARRGDPVNVCIACNQACLDRSIVDGRVSCMVNPRAGRELEHRPSRRPAGADVRSTVADARSFAVIGGGPAGLEAARALAEGGHRVQLFEADDELGGQFRLARLVPGKEDFDATIRYFTLTLERLGVTIHLGRPIGDGDGEVLAGFDGVVLATGVHPRRIELPGADMEHVLDYPSAFAADLWGERVAIIGAGGIGVDLAHRLSAPAAAVGPDAGASFRSAYGLACAGPVAPAPSPTRVTLICRGARVGARIGRSTRWVWLDALRRAGVELRTGVSYREITDAGVLLAEPDGSANLIPADTVLIAAGQESNDVLRGLLEKLDVPHRVVGGARDAEGLDAVRAFAEGLWAGEELMEV